MSNGGTRTYRDLHEHLQALEDHGLLLRISRTINKDTELHPLVRWQFRGGIPEEDRKAWLFESVTDSKGKHYDFPVAVAALAGSRAIYAIGLRSKVDDVPEVWKRALANPIAPVLVQSGPVHEEIHTGADLQREGLGLDELPIPISTPGFDNAPYTTCSHWITKDPETGIRNVGNYRGQVKGRSKLGIYPGRNKDLTRHWQMCAERKMPLQAALVIGAPPVVSYAAVQRLPYGLDEIAVAGGLAREPIRMVKCKTVDLEVPAEAELVIEGILSTEWVEPEGPFGESHGYVHLRGLNPFMEITAITHRKDMVYVSFISQVTPSESSVIKKVGYDTLFLRFLQEEKKIRSVRRVMMHEPLTNLRKLIILQMEKPSEEETWQALEAALTFHKDVGKLIIAVDTDIEPDNLDAVMWAMSYRMNPQHDVRIVTGRGKGHAPRKSEEEGPEDSALLINAILKESYPPVSLPAKRYMERAREIWEELKLPPLKPEAPWYGYSLGDWSEEYEEEARLAALGECYKTGEKLARRRVKVTGNTIPDLRKSQEP